eukprot:m.114155 g.114155  ORF g.114155 m.114155 type:complete len:63 (+) comp9274_c2_seq3:924-1112(+)
MHLIITSERQKVLQTTIAIQQAQRKGSFPSNLQQFKIPSIHHSVSGVNDGPGMTESDSQLFF